MCKCVYAEAFYQVINTHTTIWGISKLQHDVIVLAAREDSKGVLFCHLR